MRITYIHHSGFLAETGQALLLFDYAGGTLPELSRDKALIVFASHRHGDHFDPAIFALADRHPDVTYVLSDDIWENQVPEARFGQTRFVDPGKVLRLNKGGGICITAFRSTDEGVAFMIETEGRTLYHAGDLNDWHWNGEAPEWNQKMHTDYLRELERIHSQGFVPDAAMVPLDGRLEDKFCLGLDEFMTAVGAGMVFPMHLWEDYSLIGKLKALPCSQAYRDRIADIEKPGDVFEV